MNNILDKAESKIIFILSLLLICVLNTWAQNNESEIQNIKSHADTLLAQSGSSVEDAFSINKDFTNKIYKENFKLVPSKVNIYDLPYSTKGNYPNYRRLALNTGVLYGAGLVALGVLHALPEDATSWNKDEIMKIPPFKRWWRNVKKGPVIDKDNAIFNYVLHPYGGAAYYMSARSLGFNLYYSFLYSAGISAFFWEYGIEAFMEIPSIQDLIITPVAGTIIGESFYILKRHIVSNGYRLFGSHFLGCAVAYLIDPINEVIGIFAGNPNKKKKSDISLAYVPWINTTRNQTTLGFTLSLNF